MEGNYKPLKSGYAPDPKDMPKIKQMYQTKFGYMFFSVLIFIITLVGLYLVYDLKETGFYFTELTIDTTIVSWYLAGLALVLTGMWIRACVCVVCSKPHRTRFIINDYCLECGASLFQYEIFANQKEEKSKHDLTTNERFQDMVARKNTDAVRMLLYKGAEVNSQDRFGNTPLMNAAMRGSEEMVDLLLQYRADPGICNNFGLDALMIAVDKRQFAVAKKLLEAGACTQGKDKDGRTAMAIAESLHDEEMKTLLSQYKNQTDTPPP